MQLSIVGQKVADENDRERRQRAQPNALESAEGKQPVVRRRDGHGGAADAEQNKPENQHPSPSVKIGDDAEQGREHNAGERQRRHGEADLRCGDVEIDGDGGQNGVDELRAAGAGDARGESYRQGKAR
jgi:hypothetical protein